MQKNVITTRVANQLNTPPETTVCQKLMILLATGTFIGLAALTAALPMNRDKNQDSMQADAVPAGTINNGDIAWMIAATILGFSLIPAFSYLYTNLYGRTSSLLTEVVVLMSAMIAFLWIVISFSLVYAKDANGDRILGFPKYFYMFARTVNFPDASLAPTVPLGIFAVFELAFALLTPTIVATAIIDRVNVYGFLAFIFIWHLTVYAPVAHIVWHPEGFFRAHEIIDFSGGIVVNMLASITILGTHLFLNWKGAPKQEPVAPRDPYKLLINSLVVWFLWFGINAGKAHAASGVAGQSIVNTIAGVSMSIFLNFLIDTIFDLIFDEVAIVNAILLGLIATTPSSGYVTVGGSMVIAIIVTLSTRIFANVFLKEGVNAPYSVVTLHGFGGSIAFLFTAMLSYKFINAEGMQGLTYGFQTGIRHHVAVVLAMWSCGILAIFVCLFLSDLFVPLMKNPDSEKGAFEPAPLGPLRAATNVEHTDVYKPQSNFNEEANAEQPVAAEPIKEGAENA